MLIFSQMFQLIWMKCSMLPQLVGLLKLKLNLFHTIDIPRGESTNVIFQNIPLELACIQMPMN